jgi:fluoride exporter
MFLYHIRSSNSKFEIRNSKSFILVTFDLMYRILLLVGSGSFAGGISRYLLQQFIQARFPSSIPLGTLVVNILGCLIIGIIFGFGEKGNMLTPEMRLLLATGFCGGFTTFSSFAYENVALVQASEYFYTIGYILLSVVLGFIAVYVGLLLVKLFF